MKLIAGLGNPGRKYAGTRHNVGFDVVDLLAERHGVGWESAPADALMGRWRAAGVLLVKPLTFMNLSGQAVGELLRYFKIELPDLLVVVDEVQLELGRLRARPNGIGGRPQRAASRSSSSWGPNSSRGCGWASAAATRGGTSRITCWRSSTPASARR